MKNWENLKKQKDNWKKQKEKILKENIYFFYNKIIFFSQISGIRQNYWPDIRWLDIRPNQYPCNPSKNVFFVFLLQSISNKRQSNQEGRPTSPVPKGLRSDLCRYATNYSFGDQYASAELQPIDQGGDSKFDAGYNLYLVFMNKLGYK